MWSAGILDILYLRDQKKQLEQLEHKTEKYNLFGEKKKKLFILYYNFITKIS